MKFVNFVVEHWDALVGVFTTIVSVVVTIIVAVKNKNWNLIKGWVSEAVQEAEKFVNYTGEEKKAYVLTKIRQYTANKNIKFNTDKVSALIEELVLLSKNVNARDKDKTETTK